jgi:hypothetical protein
MSITPMRSKGHCHQARIGQFFTKGREPIDLKIVAVYLLFLTAFFLQMQYSDAETTKPPILFDSEFTQPQKLQLRF